MIYLLWAFCAILILIIGILLTKIAMLHKATDEICTEFAAKLTTDTNTGIDITTADPEMRRLAAELDHQLKLLRKEHIRYSNGDCEIKEAITNISHDLRTPLTAICGYMEMLEREDTSETVREYLGIIANRIDSLKQLTEELFRFSVVVSVDRYDNHETVNLNQALEESVAAYYGALVGKGINPEITMPEEKIERQLHKASLSRILGNVLSNVVKYSDGDLDITLTEKGVITFSNHARQLDEVLVGKLFDRFYTVEAGQHSTGLGLSIARALTEQMGGKISAKYASGVISIEISLEDMSGSRKVKEGWL